jgi:UDP-N-acetylglucosamine 2-epimerase (non-hydrolysing)
MNIVCVAGARPNFMKIKPVMDALEKRGADVTFVHTEQHYDSPMSDVFLEELGIRRPDLQLGAGSGTHAEQTARVMTAFERVIDDRNPDWTVVVGDVNSTLACSLVVAKSPGRLAHVEAGLRSRDLTMPEEINRIVTDAVSDLLLAPSQDAVDNLLSEGRSADQIKLVGNVMIDTLFANVTRGQERPVLTTLGLEAGGYALVTLHRPDNVDRPEILTVLLGSLGELATHLPVIFPVHPRTRSRLDGLQLPPGIQIMEPMGYLDFLALESQARLVLTDSGGVQEETTVLGVPCLTLRDTTERPITITEGTNSVVGRDPELIRAGFARILTEGVPPRRPALWDGHASDRIADALMDLEPA